MPGSDSDGTSEAERRQQIAEAVARVAGCLADVDTPGWNTPEEVLECVREQRRDVRPHGVKETESAI